MLLLIGLYVPLGLTLLGPVIVNILLFHIFLDPSGLPLAIIVSVLALFLLLALAAQSCGGGTPATRLRIALVSGTPSGDAPSVAPSATAASAPTPIIVSGTYRLAARLLREAGRRVKVLCVAPPSELSGDALTNLQRLPGPGPVRLDGSPWERDGAAPDAAQAAPEAEAGSPSCSSNPAWATRLK